MPEPYIKLNPADARSLASTQAQCLSFSVEGQTLRLPLVISEGLTAGTGWLTDGHAGHCAGADRIAY
ncbi:NADH-ubiquinone oxidoreductase subunit G [Klebsiella pneumoniae]|uniref:NADH-ubiquinone oxidoreductase subunit G n=1 Tax=Klebsiella pneumoniae TaxID=573 RepID=A0A378FYZ8_KLEPN|nr:NADH-ubiquinone oxidoreductase subunit G [Klebsiella pneumoniae]